MLISKHFPQAPKKDVTKRNQRHTKFVNAILLIVIVLIIGRMGYMLITGNPCGKSKQCTPELSFGRK